MSYSFTVKAATKDEAKAKVKDEIAAVVRSQPTHEAYADAVVAVVHSFIDILMGPHDDQEVVVSVNGSLGWWGEGEFTAASVSVSASLRNKA